MRYSIPGLAFTLAAALAIATFAIVLLSLSERVQTLETPRQAQRAERATSALPGHAEALQREVAALRALLEEQAYRIDGVRKAHRARYVDLDSRLTRIEGDLLAVCDEGFLESPADAAPSTAAVTFRAACESRAGTAPAPHRGSHEPQDAAVEARG